MLNLILYVNAFTRFLHWHDCHGVGRFDSPADIVSSCPAKRIRNSQAINNCVSEISSRIQANENLGDIASSGTSAVSEPATEMLCSHMIYRNAILRQASTFVLLYASRYSNATSAALFSRQDILWPAIKNQLYPVLSRCSLPCCG